MDAFAEEKGILYGSGIAGAYIVVSLLKHYFSLSKTLNAFFSKRENSRAVNSSLTIVNFAKWYKIFLLSLTCSTCTKIVPSTFRHPVYISQREPLVPPELAQREYRRTWTQISKKEKDLDTSVRCYYSHL